jgi:hypothetical protein
MPVLEPATFQEIKDWIKDAFELSGETDLYFTYVLTTNQADGGGTVRCRPNLFPSVNHLQRTLLTAGQLPVDRTVMIPPHTSLREATLAARYQKLLAAVRTRGLNRVEGPAGAAPLGFVSAGLSYGYLVQALDEMGLAGHFPVLKFGMSFPLDETLLRDFAARVLADAGYEVSSVDSGTAAIARMGDGFEIVVTDLDMPGGPNGVAVTEEARRSTAADVLIMIARFDLSLPPPVPPRTQILFDDWNTW